MLHCSIQMCQMAHLRYQDAQMRAPPDINIRICLKEAEMSNVTIEIYNPSLLFLLEPNQRTYCERIRRGFVQIWLDRGFFQPEKAKVENLWLDFVDKTTAKMVNGEDWQQKPIEGPDLAVISESTKGSKLFVDGTTDDSVLIEKFELEAGDDIAKWFPGCVVDFWHKIVIGKFGEHFHPAT